MRFRLANTVGRIGEDTCCVFLMKRGHRIHDRNYWKRWGEIDIVSELNGMTHFVEVKTVTRDGLDGVTRETGYRPEENVHRGKRERLARVIQSYIAEKGTEEGSWQFDVACVYLDHGTKRAKVLMYENIIL